MRITGQWVYRLLLDVLGRFDFVFSFPTVVWNWPDGLTQRNQSCARCVTGKTNKKIVRKSEPRNLQPVPFSKKK